MSDERQAAKLGALDACIEIAGDMRHFDYITEWSELLNRWSSSESLAQSALDELTALRARVAEYEPYYRALRERHNGYQCGSPPATPEAVLDSLCDESESLASATIDLLGKRMAELESELERLRAACEHVPNWGEWDAIGEPACGEQGCERPRCVRLRAIDESRSRGQEGGAK